MKKVEHSRFETIKHELKHHMPFTLLISFLAGVIVLLWSLKGTLDHHEMEAFFELMHPAHVLVSAAATAAIYNKYKKNYLGTIVVGFFGALIVGTVSDVLFPWISGSIFGLHTHLNLPFIEEPFVIFGAAIVGSLFGKWERTFSFSHSLHVFLSVFASMAYLLAFSIGINVGVIALMTLIVFLAVYLPCCISDIVFPIFFISKPCKECGHWHEKHN